jgi:hypothetical protein
MTETAVALPISLETGCDHAACSEFAWPLHRQLANGGYDQCSVMALPDTLGQWRNEHRTARKRSDRAKRRGYRFVADVKRHERADEIYAINTSADERQGRPMSDGYRQHPPTIPDPGYPCRRHGVHPYGVETADGTLVAYLWLYRAGELALVSQILGHADHLENEVMYLLWEGMVALEASEPGFVVYNRHDSGTDGLRFYKERVGLAETCVEWVA